MLEPVHHLAAVARHPEHVLAAHAADLGFVAAGLHQEHHVRLQRRGLVGHQPRPLVHGGADRVAAVVRVGEALAPDEGAQLGVDLGRRPAGADEADRVLEGGLGGPEQPLERRAGLPDAGGAAGIAPVAVDSRREVGHHRVAGLDLPVHGPAGEAGGALGAGEEVAGDRDTAAGELLDRAADVGEHGELAPTRPHAVQEHALADRHRLGAAGERRELGRRLGRPRPAHARREVGAFVRRQQVAQRSRGEASLGGDPPANPEPCRQPADRVAPSLDVVHAVVERVALIGLRGVRARLLGLHVGADDPGRAVRSHQRQRRPAGERRRAGLDRDHVAGGVGHRVHAGQQPPVRPRRLDSGGRARLPLVHGGR